MIVLGQGETDPLSVLSVREHTLKSYLIQLSHPGKATWKGEPIRESRRARWKLPAPTTFGAAPGLQQQQVVASLAPSCPALGFGTDPTWSFRLMFPAPLTMTPLSPALPRSVPLCPAPLRPTLACPAVKPQDFGSQARLGSNLRALCRREGHSLQGTSRSPPLLT